MHVGSDCGLQIEHAPPGRQPQPLDAAHTHTHTAPDPPGIYLMHLGGNRNPWMQRVAVAGGPLSPASVLRFLPLPPAMPQGNEQGEGTGG